MWWGPSCWKIDSSFSAASEVSQFCIFSRSTCPVNTLLREEERPERASKARPYHFYHSDMLLGSPYPDIAFVGICGSIKSCCVTKNDPFRQAAISFRHTQDFIKNVGRLAG
jgi:hypothetical protein